MAFDQFPEDPGPQKNAISAVQRQTDTHQDRKTLLRKNGPRSEISLPVWLCHLFPDTPRGLKSLIIIPR